MVQLDAFLARLVGAVVPKVVRQQWVVTITIGFGGGHSVPKLLATIGIGGAINGVDGATNASLGYLSNHMSEYAGQKVGHDAFRSPMDRPPQNYPHGFDPAVNKGFAGAKEVVQGGAAAACFTSLVVCTQGSRIPGAIINPATPYPYACTLSAACTVGETAYRGLKGGL